MDDKKKVLTLSARPVSPVVFSNSVSGEGSSFSIAVPPPTESAASLACPRVLVVSSRVKSPSVVLSAAREDVVTILFSFESTLDVIIAEVIDRLAETLIIRLALF
jgi:hypothetical protein